MVTDPKKCKLYARQLMSVFRRSVGDEIQKIIDTLDDCLLDISSGSEQEEEDPQD
jgi:hypothetical protein